MVYQNYMNSVLQIFHSWSADFISKSAPVSDIPIAFPYVPVLQIFHMGECVIQLDQPHSFCHCIAVITCLLQWCRKVGCLCRSWALAPYEVNSWYVGQFWQVWVNKSEARNIKSLSWEENYFYIQRMCQGMCNNLLQLTHFCPDMQLKANMMYLCTL